MRFRKTDSGTLNSLHLKAHWVPWVLDAEKERRFKTVDVRCYRRGMKIKGTNKITNGFSKQQNRSLRKSIVKRWVRLVSRVMRHGRLLTVITVGLAIAERRRGRPRLRYIERVLKRKGERREEWRTAANLSLD